MGITMTYGFYRVGQGIREQKYVDGTNEPPTLKWKMGHSDESTRANGLQQRAREREDVVAHLPNSSSDSRGGSRFGEEILRRPGEREAVAWGQH